MLVTISQQHFDLTNFIGVIGLYLSTAAADRNTVSKTVDEALDHEVKLTTQEFLHCGKVMLSKILSGRTI